MNKYLLSVLLKIVLLAALITGCNSNTESVEGYEKDSSAVEAGQPEGEGTDIDSGEAVEGLSGEGGDSEVFLSMRADDEKPFGGDAVPIPSTKPPYVPELKTSCSPSEVKNRHMRFYAEDTYSHSLYFERTDESFYTDGYIRVIESLSIDTDEKTRTIDFKYEAGVDAGKLVDVIKEEYEFLYYNI